MSPEHRSSDPHATPDRSSTGRPPAAEGHPDLVELTGAARERAVPVLRDAFVGIYRWHAKRTLREVPIVRALEQAGEVVGVGLLDVLAPEVGYVYYIAVRQAYRRRGLGARLLDDALDLFRSRRAVVVYAAVQTDNLASQRLFERRGFRPVERKERSWRDGGLGAWGFRSRMWLVAGEQLFGRRLDVSVPPATEAGT